MGWKKERMLEVSKAAWWWCVHNGHTFKEKRGTKREAVVNQDTMDLVTRNCKVAKHTFVSRRKEKLQCKRTAERVARNAKQEL